MSDIAVTRLYVSHEAPPDIQNRSSYTQSSPKLNALIQTKLIDELPGTHNPPVPAHNYKDIWDIHITIVSGDQDNDHITFDMSDKSKLRYNLPYRIGRRETILRRENISALPVGNNKANSYLYSYNNNGPIKKIIEFIEHQREVKDLIKDKKSSPKKSSPKIKISRIGPIRHTRSRFIYNPYSMFNKKKKTYKGKNKKKRRTRTKPKSKNKSRMGRSPHKPKKQRTRTKPKK